MISIDRKCRCIFPNNQPRITCQWCREKEQFNRACGYTEVDWDKKSKMRLEWELEVWIRAKEKAYKDFDDFVAGCVT